MVERNESSIGQPAASIGGTPGTSTETDVLLSKLVTSIQALTEEVARLRLAYEGVLENSEQSDDEYMSWWKEVEINLVVLFRQGLISSLDQIEIKLLASASDAPRSFSTLYQTWKSHHRGKIVGPWMNT